MSTSNLNSLKGPSSCLGEALAVLVEGRDLSAAQMGGVMRALMTGAGGEDETAELLTALRRKGESAAEIAAAAEVLRTHMLRLETGRDGLLDTCGTGGDGAGTFNISTAAALVAAGAGVPVVKHGNRAVSSRSGSADVLEALGVTVDGDALVARRCLERAGLAFCFAPRFHPALQHLSAVRRRLKVRTLFNCLGPLANPASAPYQLIGVGHEGWLDSLAGALAQLGVRQAFLVHGRDGLDEVSLSAPTLVRRVKGSTVTPLEWSAADFGLEPCTLDELRASDAQQSAATLTAVLEGQEGPATRVVLANAAAALFATESVSSLREGVSRAAQAIATGRAKRVLQALVECSRT